MRIAFLGKGGSGKTTTTAGFVRYAAQKHPFVLAIDADMNVHLRQALNLPESNKASTLGDNYEQASNYFRGERSDLGERAMSASTPPTYKSNFVIASPTDPFIRQYSAVIDNISLLTVGTYNESDVGSSCYHGKLSTLAIMMHHMLDTADDIIIADTTAGTDNVSTSLHLAYDMNVFVVEPTEKSLKVFHDYIGLAPHLAERTFAVANKITCKGDEEFIQKSISEDKLLGFIPLSKNLKRFEQGQKDILSDFHLEQSVAFDAVYATLKQCRRNWTEYSDLLRISHKKVSEKWLNGFYSTEMSSDLDTDFDYEQALVRELDKRRISPSNEDSMNLVFSER